MSENWWEDSEAAPQDNSSNDAWWKDSAVDGAQESDSAFTRFKHGAGRAVDSARTAMTDDPKEIARIAAEQAKNAPQQTPLQRQMADELAPYNEEAKNAEGVVDNVKAWGALGFKRAGQLLSNPAEAGRMMAEQIPNSIPGMVGGIAGAKAGATIGTAVAGPWGMAIGGIGGGLIGGFAGGYGLEKGAAMQELVQKEAQARSIPMSDESALTGMVTDKYDEFESTAQRKGVGTAGTDALLNVATMGLAGVGGRAIAKEASALNAAVQSGAMTAAQGAERLAVLEAQNAARNTLGAKTLRGTGVVGAEMAGEGISEAVGQKYAYGEVNPSEVIDEVFLGFGQGAGMALGHGAINRMIGTDTRGDAERSLAEARQRIEEQVDQLPEHQQNAARARLNAQLQAEARMAGLAEEEQGQQDVPPGNPNDYRATPAWAKPPQDAEQDFGNYDDEILQSTGMEQRPTPHPVRTAVQDAADAGGGLSAAAGLAMDSGITPLPAYMPPAIQEQAPQEPAKPKVVLQNRDRSEQASIAQMQEIRRDPQYLKVGPSNNMTDGAPVVIGELPPHAVLGRKTKIIDGKGGVIEVQYAIVDASDLIPSHTADGTVVPEYAEGVPGKMRSVVGIARTSGLQAAYADGNANQYKQDLLDDSPNQHIDAGAVTTPSPMLVRVMSDADVMPDIGDRSNISNTLDLSPKDQAANDARRVKIREMSFDEKGNPTQDSLLDFIAQTPTTETSKLITSDSQPSRQAVERFRAATFHEAYQDPALTELYTTEPNPEAKLVLGAAADAAGLIANLRGTGEFDVGDALTDAVRLAVLAARQNVPIDKLAATRGLEESDQAYEEKLTLARFLADNRQSKQRMSDGLRRWGQLVLKEAQTAQENQRQGGMFGATPTRSRQELFATLGSADNPTAQALNERTQQTEAVTAPLVDEQAPAPQQQPAPLPVPGNYTGAPSVTMGTRTEASAGPAFGLKDALAMIRAKKRGESEAAAPVAAPAPEIFSPEQNTAAPALGNAVRQQTQNQSGLMSGQVDNSLNVGSLDQYTEKTPAQQDTPVDTAQAWASMPTDQRKAVAAEAGLPPIVSNNIGKAQWEAINPKAQGKLAEVMAAQAQPAQEQEAVPEDAPPALTPYAPADIEQRQAQQTEATRAEAEAAADAQAKPEAAQEEASVKKPGRGVLAKLEAQRAQKQREQEDADASAKAAEQVRNAELVYNAKRRLAAAYRNEPHGGIDEDYETLRGMLEVRANDSDNPNSGMARDVLDSFDDSIANAKLKEGRTQPQAAASEAPTLELTGQTAEEARAQAASQQAEAARKQGETTQAQSEDERKRIAAASVKAADSFELGQDPMDSLTGQKDVFGAMEEAPEPPAAPKNLKEGIERAQQNAQSAKAAEIATNEGSNRVGKFAYDIEPTSGYMLAEFSSPPTADGLRIGAENAEELKQQIQRAMDTHDASPYLKMRWKRPGAGQVTLVKLVSLPNSADKSELYEVTFSGGGSMRIDAHRMEESAARDSEAASEEGMAKAKIEREAYQKAEEAAKQSEKDQAARAEAFNLEVKRFADSMGYTALRAGSVRAALKRVHNYEGMGIMSALEFMKKMVANGHAPVEHLPVPQGMPQLHETLGMTDEQVSKFKARRLKNDTTPTYTISGFDITKTESDFAKYLQEGIAQAQQNAAQATQQAENLAWVEKSTGYEPARPAGRPYVLKAGELGRATTVAGKFGEKPKFSDMNRYFASPEEAQDWGKANGYLVGSNPYAATQPEATSKTLAQPQRFTLSIPSVFENMPYVASAPVPTDGDVVSSRIITTNTSITKSDLRTLGLGEDKKKIYAWRVSVARWPDGAFSSLIEAMDMDYGRSPKGEVVAYFKLVDNAEAVNRIAPAIAKAALQDWETASKPVQPSVFDAPVDQGASNTPEATGKTLARSAAEKVLGNRFELSENDKEAKNVSAIAGTKDAYITQDGKELHIVEAVANENLKNATTEAIQEALEKRRPGTDAAKRLQAELDNRGGAVAKPASLKEGIAQARANKAGAAQTQYNNGKLDTDPNDMDAAKIERGYSNLSHNLTAKVEMERKWYVDAVQAFHDALAPVAQAEQQAEKLGDLVDAFKADYVQRRNRVLTVAESSYSAAIAGRSKLNTGQVNTRADAWARAEQAFSQWVAEEKEIAKAALLELRTEGQRDADKQSAENKRVTELVEPVVRSILNLGAIDEGQMPGMSRSSFADSASRKMAALHKNGEVAALEQVFEAIDEWDAAHKKPLFTSKSPVWGYRPAPTAKPVQSAKAEALRPALTPAAPVQQAEAAPVVKAPAATVSTNTVFTEDAAAAARARLKKKLGQLNSGLDPEMMMDGITLAGYHIEKGARTFAAYAKAMLADLGDGVKPYLKSWYMGVKYDPRATTFTGMDSAAVVDSADIDALMAQKDEDVPSTDARVERDSQVPAAESAVGDTVSADPGTTAEGVGKVGGRTGGKSGSGQQDGAGVPFGSAPVAGERGDQRVHTGEPVPELAGIIAGTEFSERSGDDGVGGVPPDSIPASKVEATANQPVDRVKAGVEQARANNAPVKLGDIDSIKATLPQLHPGQQDDVQKAEKRFATPDGYGMLFTNGTGTGKTFSGLGVVKRFALQGKTNTLIVVPDDKIANDWIESAKLLGLGASKLESTKDAGNGIVITSYANLGENDALAGRDWDLVVADEVHTLMQAADGTETGYLQNLRAITHHPDGMFTRYSMQNRDKIALLSELTKKRTANTNLINSGDATDADVQSLRTENTRIEKQRSQLIKELDDARKEMNTEVEEKQGAGRTRLVALSATPFAYEKTVDWANGYLFDYKDGYPHNENSTVYNQPTPREYFFQTRFGYRMRYGKLTAPDSNVDSGMMQRQFNGELKKSGALSGRMLDVPHDYDRRFVLVNSAIGNRIDEALEWLNEARRSAAKGDSGASELAGVINEQFKYLQKRYLLEAIKASEAVPIIKQHMALGRKVVVFHDYKKGGASNPFKVSPIPIRAGAEPSAASVQFNQAIESFNDKFADLINHPLLEGADSPIEVFSRELPGTLFVNGNEKKADLLARYKSFQDDATGPQVMLVQSAKNKGWSGHDTTGKHQRVLINLGQPTAPTMAVQQEGRIYRTGQASDAIMRYMNTGTNWERWTFASTIASRASTAENLGMGEQARALKDSFINAFEQSDTYAPGHEGEGKGGKDQDAAANNALTEYDRAKSLYFANQKKTSKTKAAEGVDYFATPEPVGLKMVEWLDVRSGEDVLEPSGGHGAIARWFPEKSNKTVIEPSLALRSRLALAMNAQEDRLLDGTFEEHNVVNKYDGIVMNPPFGVGGKTAIEHLAKAATHLRDGGRIVALIPTGPAADKRFEQWMYGESDRPTKPLYVHPKHGPIYKGDTVETGASWAPVAIVKNYSVQYGVAVYAPENPSDVTSVNASAITKVKPTGKRTERYSPTVGLHTVADIKLPTATFNRAGTAVATRIVVIEKQSKQENAPAAATRQIDLSGIEKISELFDRLEDMRLPVRPKADAAEDAPQKPPAKTAATARAEKAKAQTAKAGAAVKLGGKDYEVAIYTTNAGKELRGVWMATRTEAEAFTNSPFQKRPLGWFVRESNFPAGAVQQAESQSQPADAPSRSRQQSPATPATPIATVRSALTQAYGKLADQLEQRGLVTVVQTQEQAIEAAAQARAAKTGQSVEQAKRELMDSVDVKRSADGNVQGFFDPQSGQAFLVADHLTAEAAPGVLMHEVGIHMAADKTLAPLFNRAKLMLSMQKNDPFMQRVKAKMDAAGETSGEEVAAYMVEEYERSRTNAPASVARWLSDLLATVKAWMHRKGIIGADSLTVADIAAVARANAKSLAQGQAGQQSNADIRFSRTPQWQAPQERAEPAPATWQSPETGKWDEATYNIQDRHIDTKRVQQAIEANNGPLSDDMNVRQREELFHGRSAKEIQDFKTQELNPMLEQLGKDGIELPAFEEYLHARHAPEANKVMAERNPNQAMINAGSAQAAQEISALSVKMAATTDKTQQRVLKKALDNAIEDLAHWSKVTPYTGSEESRLMLSGMSEAQARTVMTGLAPAQKAAMQRNAALFDGIVAKNRATMVEYGLESQDTIDSWANLFKSYVPLMREEAGGVHSGLGTGEGFSIKGREVKSRTGSTRKVVDIVANLAMQREKSIVRGEKNRVTLTLLELAQANPNSDFWTIGAPDKTQQYDPTTKTVKWVTDPLYKSRENVVVAKRTKADGSIEEVAITFNKNDERAMRMAVALKNLDDASLNKVLQVLAPATRTLAALSTQYNPSWGLFNFARDTLGVMVSLGNTPMTGDNPQGESNRLRIYKDAWKALPALYRGARAERKGSEDSSEWGKLWADFQKVGGAVGFRDMLRTSNDRTEQLKVVTDPDAWMQTPWGKAITLGGAIKPLAGKVKRGAEALFNWISDFNLALENATRVSVYKAGLNQGLSKERAASVAKNITVNFNRRGAVGHQIGAAYAFFNASVQGTARMAEAMSEMRKPGDPSSIRLTAYGKNILQGSLAIGVLQAVALAAAGFGDDEPPEFVRDRNIVVPTGWTGAGPEKGYITIPLPLGYNIIPSFGRRLAEFAMSGGKDPFKHITGLMGLVFDGFNPIGSGSFTQMLAPTVLDPIIAARENKDSFGRPIARESLDANVPGHALSRSTATAISKWLSESLNSVSGGDKYTRGKFSPSPDQIDYLGAQYAGGVGREIMKVIQSTSGAMAGEDVPMYKVPLLGRLAGNVDGPSAQLNAYYRNQQDVDKAEKRIKGLREDHKMAEASAERQRIGPLLLAQSQAADRQIKTLRKTKATMMDKGADREQIKAIEERMTTVMQRFNQLAEKQAQQRKLVTA